jgi:hypothetical protein
MSFKIEKNIPQKIYTVNLSTYAIELYEYYGTDREERIAPFFASDYHVFIMNMGKPTVQKLEINCFDFDLSLNDRDYFTCKKGCEEFRKTYIKDKIQRIKENIAILQQEEVELTVLLNRGKKK